MSTNDSLGEQLYEYSVQMTGATEYGASMAAVLSGEAPMPPSGLRVDVSFEGPVTGRLAGTLKGVDYLNVRADGRSELDIKGTITTSDGENIALSASGVAIAQPGSTVSLLRENVKLTTASAKYSWVNSLQIWGIGSADFATGMINVRGYQAH